MLRFSLVFHIILQAIVWVVTLNTSSIISCFIFLKLFNGIDITLYNIILSIDEASMIKKEYLFYNIYYTMEIIKKTL